MNPPDPESRDALEYLEDWHRLGLTGPHRPGTSGQPHVCDEQCTATPSEPLVRLGRTARINPLDALAFGVASAAAAQHESEAVARTIRDAPNGVAYLDELLRVAIEPARRRRWWWLW